MEVIVHCSLLGHPQDYVVVATDPTQAVDSLVTAYCIEKGIPQHKHYVLKNSDGDALESTKSLATVGILNGDHLYISSKRDGGEWCFGCNQWWLLAAVALLIGAAGMVAISLLKAQAHDIPTSYGVVIDAGSSHSQVFTYHWPGSKNNGTAVVSQLHTCKEFVGIADFAPNPSAAGPNLTRCLNEAVHSVPKNDYGSTPLYLGATAGMRLLDAANKSASDAILSSVRGTMATYPFNFSVPEKQARILDGREEGTYSWMTVNYVLGNFGIDPLGASILSLLGLHTAPETYGALDLGGASTQITYMPKDITDVPESELNDFMMFGTKYVVYTHSYMCYGQNEAHRKYLALLVQEADYNTTVDDPCRPSGNSTTLPFAEVFEAPCTHHMAPPPPRQKAFTFEGQGDSSRCQEMTLKLFNTSCRKENPHCTFDDVYQPDLHGKFMAFSGFFYTMHFLNLTGRETTLKEFEDATSTCCSQTGNEIDEMTEDPFKYSYCFNAHYIHGLLVDMYGFNESNWSRLNFTDNIQGTDVGWTVGFMLNTSNTLPVGTATRGISTTLFVLLMLLFLAFLAVAIGFACHARQLQKRQRQYQVLTSYGSI